MKKLMLLVAVTFAMPACASQNIKYKNPTIAAGGETKSAKQSFYLWGLAGGSEINLERLCPNGVAAIDSKTTFGDQVLTLLTVGLYAPVSVDVRCGGSVAAAE